MARRTRGPRPSVTLLNIRLTEEEMHDLDGRAKSLHLNLSAYVRLALFGASEQIRKLVEK